MKHTVSRLIAAALLLICSSAAAQPPPPPHRRGSDDATTQRRFEDVEQWRKVFDDPKREHWQKPEEVVGALGLKPGMRVADLGAGTGYFNRRLSRAVGERGAVFAVEVEPRLLEHLRQRAERENTANVIPVLASRDNPRLPPRAIDMVLIVDTYHHIDGRLAYMRRLHQSLAPRGRVAIVDWYRKRNLPEGPPLEHKLSRLKVVREMESAGYRLIAEPRLLPYQYFLIFTARD